VPAACTYVADPTYVPPAGTATHAGEKGEWYLVTCPDALKGGIGFTSENNDVWLTSPPPPAPPTAEQLAAEATAELKLPAPGIQSSPTAGSPELVGVPVWVWASSSSWSSRSATATAAAVSVTATAAPVSVTWSFGDGTSITCDGPGTVYSPSFGAGASSPTCGHTYTQIGGYALTATVHWKITWAGAGESGVFNGMTTTSSEQVTVEQSNAVVTG
jgi:PKD domain